ncbi:MAG: 2-phosphosulfolactate phosphatase [candidate division KSB1 bacterium]|nr:2-phosphosulfolactate phosphatase [candidate division KSB1 bacterium]MDZ7317987.1 2-phosphosulfolactate phosphatase [candidate division KSB1 bacterium]MDZ7340656.1 2-phosphosulfolactate phosphatase [candidate division KSB1 bacterium]
MNIDIYLSLAEIDSAALKDRLAVVIDVLRASTSIITALANGATSVIPMAEVAAARSKAKQYNPDQVLLGGERNELPLAGFHLSNSPADYAATAVQGKRIIFTSSNGAQLFQLIRPARKTVVAGFVNMSAIAHYIERERLDVTLLCAGKQRRIGLEDVICGGMIINRLAQSATADSNLTEAAVAAQILYQHYADNILDMLYERPHGQRLIEIGQENDLRLCGAIDAHGIVPILCGEELIALPNHKD